MIQRNKKINFPKKEDILVRKMNIWSKFGQIHLFDRLFDQKPIYLFDHVSCSDI